MNLPLFLSYLTFLFWCLIWSLGGIWLARRAFRLVGAEETLIGIGIGLVLQTWLANWSARFIPIPAAFWATALVVFALGLIAALSSPGPYPQRLKISLPWGGVAILLAITLLFTAMGRGLGIFDDYQNLPITSQLALGDIPPRFSLDPNLGFGYHYFLLLFAAQFMRIANSSPWVALDLARGIALGLALVYVWILAFRLTHHRIAALLSSLFVAFAGGVRWVLLLAPAGLVDRASSKVNLMGSGLDSAPDLFSAITHEWVIAGKGPAPFPFAFGNGVNTPLTMVHNGVGAIGWIMILLILLTFDCWAVRWLAAGLTTIVLASFGMAFEALVILLISAWVFIAAVQAMKQRSLRLAPALWLWLGMQFAAGVLILIQGGVFSQIFYNLIFPQAEAAQAYFTFSFPFTWPPIVISSHLGILPLTDPYTLFVALLEIRPLLLALPLLVRHGLWAYRQERWYEAALILAAFLACAAIFLRYSGSAGISATTRLYAPLLNIATLYAVPLAWNWAKDRPEWVQAGAGALGFATMLGGIVYFSVQLIAIQKPIRTYFLSNLDEKVYQEYWNKLEPDALVFDPNPPRGVTLFGRFTNSGISWYEEKPAFLAFRKNADPHALRQAGFDYAFLDYNFVGPSEVNNPRAALLQDPCAQEIDIWRDGKDYRVLIDLRGCSP